MTLSRPHAFLFFKLEIATRPSLSIIGTFNTSNIASVPLVLLAGRSARGSDVPKTVWKCCDHSSGDILYFGVCPKLSLFHLPPQKTTTTTTTTNKNKITTTTKQQQQTNKQTRTTTTFESLIEACSFGAFARIKEDFFSLISCLSVCLSVCLSLH